ncbi:putative copper-transporting ATPase PacS [uncultured Comamonas sp.]|nr:putative copper-transporting ATPase PacS [uncultured Comamonas sp.]
MRVKPFMMRPRNAMTMFPQSPLLTGSSSLASEERRSPHHEEQFLLDDPQEWPSFGKPLGGAAPAQASLDPATVPVWDSQVVLEGMYCATCALTIEEALRRTPGIRQAEVSAAAHRARVVWDARQTTPSAWFAAIARAGYRAIPAQDAHVKTLRQAYQRKMLWRWLLATFCMMQVMMYAWPAYEAKPGDLSLEMETLLRWASWLICIPMLLYSCGPFFSGAWRDLRQRRISMDLPVALGMAITFVISSWGTFDPHGIFGREVYFDSLSMFAAFLLAGRWLEVRLRDRTAGALEGVLNRLPESVLRRQDDGRFERVALRRVAVGDILRILPGEAFPVDGVLVAGRTQADEALLTGESRPVSKTVGSSVVTGSFNLSAVVEIQVQALGDETRFAQIVGLIEHASTQKPRLAVLADKAAGPFLLGILLLAAATAVYWWPQDPGLGLLYAAVVLIVTCPCALSLATPVAMLTAAGTLARQGVLVRNLQGLEALAQVQVLVFDKTGTLTQEGLAVQASHAYNGTALPAWCSGLAVALARQSIHPVSVAVQALPQAESADGWQLLQVKELAGQGLLAQVQCAGLWQGQPRWVRLGSLAFAAAGHWPQALPQAVYLSVEEEDGAQVQPLAAFELQENVRPQAAQVVQALQAHGVQVQLLSGDGPAAVARVAHQVGITEFQATCSPQDKLAALQALQAQGKQVGMVGDGLNDGPVLAGADVSFAFGRAVPLARARSDFVILGTDLQQVLQALLFARKTLRIVRQNLGWAMAYNAVSVPFAALGMVPPWLAGLGMAASSLWVVLNAARLAQKTDGPAADRGPVASGAAVAVRGEMT